MNAFEALSSVYTYLWAVLFAGLASLIVVIVFHLIVCFFENSSEDLRDIRNTVDEELESLPEPEEETSDSLN